MKQFAALSAKYNHLVVSKIEYKNIIFSLSTKWFDYCMVVDLSTTRNERSNNAEFMAKIL